MRIFTRRIFIIAHLNNFIIYISHIIVAFNSIAQINFGLFIKSNSSSSFFRKSITFVFRIHIFFCKITLFVFKNIAIDRKKSRKKARLNLVFKINTISVNKASFMSRMRMKVNISM